MRPYYVRHVCVSLLVLLLVVACGVPSTATMPAPIETPAATEATDTGLASATAVESSGPPTATPTPAVTPTLRTDQQAHHMILVGALALESRGREPYGDIAIYKDLAFIGMSHVACADSIPIIDISHPAKPTLLTHSPPLPNRQRAALEDVAAMRIGDRDVLAIGLQTCGGAPPGLDLIDITDPRDPRRLSLFELTHTRGIYGVHEFGLTTTPDGRALALLAVPDLEINTAQDDGRGGIGDLLILDISDPTQPQQIAEWGLLDEPALGPAVANAAPQGDFPGISLHSVRASADGTRAFLSYWDAGVVILDIGNPEAPTYLGRTAFTSDEEGNAHSVAIARDGRLLIEADEDINPKHPAITSNAFQGARSVIARFPFAKPPDGDVVHVGRGCPADTVPGQPAEDPYTHEISGTVALLDPGGCPPEQKVARAQLNGATGVILYGGEAFKEMEAVLGPATVVKRPDGELVVLKIPILVVRNDTAQDLIAADEPVRIEFIYNFDGWGGLRIFDISDPQHPVRLSTFRTANAADESLSQSSTRWLTAHNPEIRDQLVFASWYRDGVRAIDIGDPSAPREVGFWTGKGAPSDAPPVDIWGIALHQDLVLASDRNFGLYILQLQP
jgi:hypothetical protein